MIGRIAWREVARHRRRTALVVAGLITGTAAITAGLVAADSVDDSATASALHRWGDIDVTVTASGRWFDPAQVQAAALSRATDGVSPGIELRAIAAVNGHAAAITLIGIDPATQRPFGSFDLGDRRSPGGDLGPDGVIVSSTLARVTGAHAGETLTLRLGDRPAAALRVAGVARAGGPGSWTIGPSLFAPLPLAQRLAGASGVNIVRVSAAGGLRPDDAALDDALAATRRAAPGLEVRAAKAHELAINDIGVSFFRGLLIGLSLLVVIVGAVLIVTMMTTLAQDRRAQLGVLRAIGMRRRRLVGLVVAEGAVYGVAAAAVGAVAGLPVGRVLASRFADSFRAYTPPGGEFDEVWRVRPLTVLTAFAAGTLLTLAVVALSARRTARLSVADAVRDLPDPGSERARHPRLRAAVLIGGALAGLGLLVPAYVSRLTGGVLLVLVLAAAIREVVTERTRDTLAGLLLGGWCLVNVAALSPEAPAGQFLGVVILAVVVSVFGLTVAAVANLPLLARVSALPWVSSGRRAAILRPALAHAARRPLRTGLLTSMLALIVAMLSLMSVLARTGEPSVAVVTNGYDVRVDMAGTIPSALRTGRTLVFPGRTYLGPVDGQDVFSSYERSPVALLTAGPQAARTLPLASRESRFPTDTAAWQAVSADPGLILTSLGAPGSVLTLHAPGGPMHFTVAGGPPLGVLPETVIMSSAALARFTAAPRQTTALIDLADAGSAAATAQRIEQQDGAQATPVQTLIDRQLVADRSILPVVDAMMRLGLIVGVAGLGIVGLRVLTERRQAIGTMRALGYRRRDVAASLLAESLVTAVIGTMVGVAAGIGLGYVFQGELDDSSSFALGLRPLMVMVLTLLGAVVLVTVGPAWQASRMPPAEAVRTFR